MKNLRQRALGFLARREHSRVELRRKLDAGGDSAELEALLLDLSREGLQSDARFTESFIRSRLQLGYGPVWIRQALLQRGIDNQLIEELLLDDEEEWQQHLQSVWQKKYHDTSPLDQKEKARRLRFLLARGFSQRMVMKIFQELGAISIDES